MNLSLIVEETTIEAIGDWRKWDGAEVLDDGEFSWVRSTLPHSLFNTVLRCTLGGGEFEDRVLPLIQELQGQGVGLTWFLFPSSDQTLAARLERVEFHSCGLFSGMAAPVSKVLGAHDPASALSVLEVTDESGLQVWSDLSAEVYGIGSEARPAWRGVTEAIGYAGSSRWRNYVGYFEGLPVATSTVFVGSRALRLSNVAVLEEHRGRGFGRQVSVAPFLPHGDDSSNPLATLISTPMAVRTYEAIGFQECFRSECYVYEPTDSGLGR